jgi:hypothetical protein
VEGSSHIGKNGLKQLDALLGMLLASDSLLRDLSVLERRQLEGAQATVQSLLLRAVFDDPGDVNVEES